MRCLIANAARCPYALKQEIIEKLGDGFLFEVYGSTELGVVAVLPPEDQLRKPGLLRQALRRHRVPDRQGRRHARREPLEPGELFICTALAMDGYHRTSEQLSESEEDLEVRRRHRVRRRGGLPLHLRPQEGHDHLGRGEHLPGRDRGGHLPAPRCPRRRGVRHPGRRVGRERLLHRPAEGPDALDLDELEAFVSERVAGYKRPRGYELRDELPRTDAGKLLKRVLRDEYWKDRTQAV